MVDNSLREKFADEKSRIIFDARMNYKRDKSLQSFYQFLKKNHEKYVFREVEEDIQKTGISRIFIWGNDDYSLYSYDEQNGNVLLLSNFDWKFNYLNRIFIF